MNFVGETIRLTPLDSRLHLIDRGPLVLGDLKIELATERDSRQRVFEQYAIEVADGCPEEWLELEVELSELGATVPASQTISDLVVAATRTSHAGIEVWGSAALKGMWPYLAVPWVDFETMGACVASGRDRVSFGGRLFDRDWGWHFDPPTESNGLQVPFVPLLEAEGGALWTTGFTDVPPPAVTPPGEWPAFVEQSEWKGYIPGRPPVGTV
ncbi:hypothetical protein AB0E78_33590 [Streptomyces sp. NPDC032198]|uniref:hypothetical protein n=1 Tax=Streptomyces sp. NPDC032198 TaxID=3155127 RepID=UPI0033CD1D83